MNKELKFIRVTKEGNGFKRNNIAKRVFYFNVSKFIAFQKWVIWSEMRKFQKIQLLYRYSRSNHINKLIINWIVLSYIHT